MKYLCEKEREKTTKNPSVSGYVPNQIEMLYGDLAKKWIVSVCSNILFPFVLLDFLYIAGKHGPKL